MGRENDILRQVLYKHVPKELIERPKMGFGIPINSWLRGPLRDWAEDLLDETRMRDEGFFDPQPVQQLWQEHLAGTHNNQYYLWDILVFQEWLRATGSPNTNVKTLLFANTAWYLYNFRLPLAEALRSQGYDVVLVSPSR